MKLHGIVTPVVTPMHANEDVDLARLRRVIDRNLTAKVHAIFVLGTTGEFYALDADEKQAVVAAAVGHVQKRVPVIAGTGAESTREAIKLTRMAEREGADAVTVITPYFVQPSQAELIAHFRAVAESTKLPIVLYQNPGHCGGVKLDVATVAKLAEVPNIVGMKDSAGDLGTLIEFVKATPAEFAVMQGRDTLIEPALCYGAKGSVPATANIAPELAVAVYESHVRGDAAGARAAQAKFSPLRLGLKGTPPGGIKAAMNAAGWDVGPSRGPLRQE